MECSEASDPFMVVQVEEAAVSEDQPDEADDPSELHTLLDTERTLKQQSVNKLAEIEREKEDVAPYLRMSEANSIYHCETCGFSSNARAVVAWHVTAVHKNSGVRGRKC